MKHLILTLLFIGFSVHAAGIKKWTDENGQVHYGDSPPAQTSSESVRVSRPPSNPGRPLPRFSSQSNEATNDPTDATQQTAAQTSEEQSQQICDQATKDLSVIKRSSRIRLQSADGESRYMTKEEIEERRKLAESDIEKYCR